MRQIDPQACLREMHEWPEYKIDAAGNIYRAMKASGATVGNAVRQREGKNGYMIVTLSRQSKRQHLLVHRLVAATFISPIPPGMDVCHFDGDKTNNTLENLRIDTRKANVADNVRLGKHNRGERCGSNKYSEKAISELRQRMSSGETVSELSKLTGIPKPTLYAIRSRQTWAWL